MGKDKPGQFDLDLYACDSLRDLAEQFVEDGLLGAIPANIIPYLDYDAIGRDLSAAYAETTVDGAQYVYHLI